MKVNYPALTSFEVQRGLASELHLNAEYLSRRSDEASPLDASGHTDKIPVLSQSCRERIVLKVIFRAPTKSECNSKLQHSHRKVSPLFGLLLLLT